MRYFIITELFLFSYARLNINDIEQVAEEEGLSSLSIANPLYGFVATEIPLIENMKFFHPEITVNWSGDKFTYNVRSECEEDNISGNMLCKMTILLFPSSEIKSAHKPNISISISEDSTMKYLAAIFDLLALRSQETIDSARVKEVNKKISEMYQGDVSSKRPKCNIEYAKSENRKEDQEQDNCKPNIWQLQNIANKMNQKDCSTALLILQAYLIEVFVEVKQLKDFLNILKTKDILIGKQDDKDELDFTDKNCENYLWKVVKNFSSRLCNISVSKMIPRIKSQKIIKNENYIHLLLSFLRKYYSSYNYRIEDENLIKNGFWYFYLNLEKEKEKMYFLRYLNCYKERYDVKKYIKKRIFENTKLAYKRLKALENLERYELNFTLNMTSDYNCYDSKDEKLRALCICASLLNQSEINEEFLLGVAPILNSENIDDQIALLEFTMFYKREDKIISFIEGEGYKSLSNDDKMAFLEHYEMKRSGNTIRLLKNITANVLSSFNLSNLNVLKSIFKYSEDIDNLPIHFTLLKELKSIKDFDGFWKFCVEYSQKRIPGVLFELLLKPDDSDDFSYIFKSSDDILELSFVEAYIFCTVINKNLFTEDDRICWNNVLEKLRILDSERDADNFIIQYFIPFVNKIATREQRPAFVKEWVCGCSELFPRLAIVIGKLYGLCIEDLSLKYFDEVDLWRNIQKDNLKKLIEKKIMAYFANLEFYENDNQRLKKYINLNKKHAEYSIFSLTVEIAETIFLNQKASVEISRIIEEAKKEKSKEVPEINHEEDCLNQRVEEIMVNQDSLIDVIRIILEIKSRIDSQQADSDIQN